MKTSDVLMYCFLILFGMHITSCSFSSSTRIGGAGKKVEITSDPGASIIVDGKNVAGNSIRIKVAKNSTVDVRVEKVGFITAIRNYSNVRSMVLPKSEYIKLEPDDAFASSVSTDVANRHVEISAQMERSEEEIWKVISRVVLDHFDVIEIADSQTGYLRTAWTANSFRAASVRTRLIVKYAGNDPLRYRIKLASEIAPALTSVKADERYDEWDRVLRVYDPIMDDLRSRLTK